jgi:hypothetical protein
MAVIGHAVELDRVARERLDAQLFPCGADHALPVDSVDATHLRPKLHVHPLEIED